MNQDLNTLLNIPHFNSEFIDYMKSLKDIGGVYDALFLINVTVLIKSTLSRIKEFENPEKLKINRKSYYNQVISFLENPKDYEREFGYFQTEFLKTIDDNFYGKFDKKFFYQNIQNILDNEYFKNKINNRNEIALKYFYKSNDYTYLILAGCNLKKLEDLLNEKKLSTYHQFIKEYCN